MKYCLAVSLLMLSTAVQAAPEEDYVVYKTAATINHACGGLKYVEHSRTLGAAHDALSSTTEYRMSNDGRLPQAEYDTWLAELDARVAEQAQAVGCTQQALQFISRGKGVASEEIYHGLTLAVHLANMPPDSLLTPTEIAPDRMLALQRYDAYLQALYRENYAAFSERQKQLAAQKLPQLNVFGGSSALGGGGGLATTLLSPEDAFTLSNAESIARYVVNEVFFEVAAETAGFLVRPRLIQNNWTIPELRPASAPQSPGFVVVEGPGVYWGDLNLEDDDRTSTELYHVVTLTPDNGLRAMFYGDAAAQIVNGTVRLHIMEGPLPEGASALNFLGSAEFSAASTPYEGVRVEAGCLSSACFDFPADATNAFVARKDNGYAGLFVSALANAQSVDTGTSSPNYGRVSNFYAYKLLKE